MCLQDTRACGFILVVASISLKRSCNQFFSPRYFLSSYKIIVAKGSALSILLLCIRKRIWKRIDINVACIYIYMYMYVYMCICVYICVCVCVCIYIYEIKRRLLLGKRAMTSLDSVLKSRDITLLTKVHIVKTMVFPVVMYGCESWTINKAERRRTDAFSKLWCWRRLLRVPWTARRSNQSILKEINPEYSLQGLMLKLQSFGHLM